MKLTKEYGILPSMSRAGTPLDNACAENFFSVLKTECINRHKIATYEEALLVNHTIHIGLVKYFLKSVDKVRLI